MITASYGDKIVKQSCYFAIICNGEINKKHMGVTLFHCNFVYVNKYRNVFVKGHKFFLKDFGFYFLKISG